MDDTPDVGRLAAAHRAVVDGMLWQIGASAFGTLAIFWLARALRDAELPVWAVAGILWLPLIPAFAVAASLDRRVRRLAELVGFSALAGRLLGLAQFGAALPIRGASLVVLVILAVISQRAANRLEQRGVRVGFLGVSRAELATLVREQRADAGAGKNS